MLIMQIVHLSSNDSFFSLKLLNSIANICQLKESSLKEVWTNRSNGLTSSVSSHVVVSFASSSFNLDDADSEVNDFLGNCRLILRNLRSVDAVGCDAGIAHAVALLKGGKKKRRKEAARRIELLIGTQAPASANPTGEAQRSEPLNQDDKSSSPAAASDEFARLLPARVALEHPDASIRLHAVKRLLDDVETAASTEADGESSPDFDSDDAVDVGRSLLRRFLADDDSGVAAAAAGAIRRLVAEDIVREEDIFGDAESIYSVISGLLKWSVLDDIPSKASLLLDVTDIDQDLTEYDKCADKLEGQPPADPIEAMCCALALAGLAASTLLNAIDDEDVFSQAIESEGELLRILLIYICAHLDITSDGLDEEKCIDACQVIHDAAASALIHAIAEDIEEESDSICDIQEKASQLICDNENCLAVLLRTCSGHTPDSVDVGQIEIDKNMERRYMWACLHCMCKGILGDGDQEEENGEEYGIGGSLEQNILTVINHILEISGEKDNLTDREAAALLGHLVPCFASIINNNPTMLPAALIDLCTSTSTTAYDKVSKPAILYLFGVTDVNDEGGGSAGATNLSPVAILLEAASRHGVEEIAITRLVSIACMSMSKDNILSRQQNIVNGLVQALSLLSHSSQSVRASAIEFISNVDSLGSKNMPTICDHLPDAIESLKSSLMMDGGALPNFLMEIVTGSNSAKEARDDLLKHCVVAAIGTTSRVDEGFSFGDYLGGSFSTYKIFNAMNQARESVFPLTERWDRAGHAVFNAFTSSDVDVFSDRYADVEMHPIKSLCEIVVLMCKGVISSKNSAPSVVISTGPAKSGRRARSYSVGAGDDGGLLIIDPYPETMSSALSEFLSGAPERIGEPYVRLMYNTIAHCILCSQTWGERIFPRLKVDARRTIASALLQLRSQREIESAGASLSNLQINESDMCHLFESEFARGSLALTCVADCIRSRAAALAGSTSALNLSALLFDKLKNLSGEPSSDGGYEYVRLSLLQALISLHGEMTKQNVSLPKKSKSARKKGSRARSQSDAAVEKFAEQATVLVALVGSEKATLGSSEVHPVRSSRGRAMVLSLLTTLCSQAPGAVVGSLIPALGNILSPSSTGNETNSLAANQALRAVVPAYCTHAAASGFSFAELVDAFIASCYTNSTRSSQRSELCTSFADALVAVETSQGHGQGIASFVGSLVAADAAALLDPAQESDNENAMDADSNDGMEEDSPDAVALSIEVLGRASTTDQVVASLQIVQYVGQMIELLGRSSDSNTNFLASALDKTSPMKKQRGGDSSGLSYVIDTHDLYRRAVAEREDRDNYKKALISLTTNLLYVIRDLYSFSSIKKVIKNNEGKLLNNVCLSLWQELVQLQSNSLRYQAVVFAGARSSDNELLRDEKEFWEGVPGAAEECLDLLQRVLPVPDYLASVTNLLQDDDTEAPLFVRTAELLSERAAEIDPYSHEATLFLEVVPELVTILRRSESDDTREDAASRRQVTIKQASLMAIERLAQALCLATGDERVFKKGSSVLLPAMKEVTVLIAFQSDNLINLTNSSSSSQIETNDGEIQLLSTAALCASTLLAVLRARCLPLLAKLVKPVISSLTSINVWLMNCNAKHRKSANLSQLALLRTLVSVAETLPQFAVPYLGILFAPSALPSRMLRSNGYEDNVIVANMTERLDRALAKRTPARQIIPAASKAVGLCLNKGDNANNSDADADDGGDAAGWQEAKALLSILKSSVECTSRAELTPVVGKLLNSILIAFKYDDDEEGQQELLAAANETLLALVLKLSEAQLRPLYARIREWRGDLDGTSREGDDDAEEAATKRYAFWSMSALLSKELRSIFLPCLSSVLSDAIKELEFAVNKLCTPDLFSKKDGGKKRRRLGDSGEGSISPSSLRPLQPILLCLESALKADAHEGGSWIRGDDGQRHALILEPLGKLLQAKLPSDLLVATNRGESTSTAISPYESLIQGIGTLDHGSVSRCIVALAMAAGDESMWKPINHALLQACENSDRAEVRRAGVHCLKSVMESIGEEYMVLLPECLPALSELLEDEDEEIAGLARECVTLGEELLGESLEDSLR